MGLESLYALMLQAAAVSSPLGGGGGGGRASGKTPTTDPYWRKRQNELLELMRKHEMGKVRTDALLLRERLRAEIDLQKINTGAWKTALEERGKDKREVYKGQIDLVKAQLSAQEKFVSKWGQRWGAMVLDAKDNIRLRGKGGRPSDAFSAGIKTLIETPLSIEANYDPDSPQFPQTVREIIKAADPGGEYVRFFTDDDGVTDVAKWVGIDAPDATYTNVGLMNILDEYNAKNKYVARIKQDYASQTAALKATAAQAETAVRQTGPGAPSDEAVAAMVDGLTTDVDTLQAKVVGYHQVVEPGVARDRIRQLEADKINTESYLLAKKAYHDNIPKQENERLRVGKMVNDPRIRAWAQDHGYFNLGSATVGADGTVTSYREGGDDIKAVMAWHRQSKRRPGNYGPVRNSSTHKYVGVQLKGDEKSTPYERQKFHAADPLGSVRIIKDGKSVLVQANEIEKLQFFGEREAPSTQAERAAGRPVGEDAVSPEDAVIANFYDTVGVPNEAVTIDDKYYKLGDDYVTKPMLDKASRPPVEIIGAGIEGDKDSFLRNNKTGELRVFDDGKWLPIADVDLPAVKKYILEKEISRTGVGTPGDEGGPISWLTADQLVPDDSGAVVLPEEFGAVEEGDMLPTFEVPTGWAAADAPEKQTVDELVKPTSVEAWPGFRVEHYARPDQPAKVEPTPVVEPEPAAEVVVPPTVVAAAEEVEAADTINLYDEEMKSERQHPLKPSPITYDLPVAPSQSHVPAIHRRYAEGGVAGKGGEEEIIVGEEGPELVLPAALTRKIMALAESRKGKKPAPETTEADAVTESDEDAELALLQEGVAQRAEGVYKLGEAMYKATDEKPPPTVATVMQIMRLTKTLTLNVSYMEEMLDRAEDEEKMSPSWYKHMNDLQFYSERVDKLNAAIDKLKEGVDMAKLQQQVQAEQPQGGSRGQ